MDCSQSLKYSKYIPNIFSPVVPRYKTKWCRLVLWDAVLARFPLGRKLSACEWDRCPPIILMNLCSYRFIDVICEHWRVRQGFISSHEHKTDVCYWFLAPLMSNFIMYVSIITVIDYSNSYVCSMASCIISILVNRLDTDRNSKILQTVAKTELLCCRGTVHRCTRVRFGTVQFHSWDITLSFLNYVAQKNVPRRNQRKKQSWTIPNQLAGGCEKIWELRKSWVEKKDGRQRGMETYIWGVQGLPQL